LEKESQEACQPAGRTLGAVFLLRAYYFAVLMSANWLRGIDMPTGIVKWFNGQKGYGFIQPDTGGKDVFVHISAVEKAGMDGLPEGVKITYDVVPNKGKESAENLKLK
jgi:CspA family cold shock protein